MASQSQQSQKEDDSKKPTPAMQWFFLIFLALWIFAAMALPAIIFCITRSSLSFVLFGQLAPQVYILYRITKNLFPMSDKDYDLAALRIKTRIPPGVQWSKAKRVLSILPISSIRTSEDVQKS